jgi:hypothetical protein
LTLQGFTTAAQPVSVARSGMPDVATPPPIAIARILRLRYVEGIWLWVRRASLKGGTRRIRLRVCDARRMRWAASPAGGVGRRAILPGAAPRLRRRQALLSGGSGLRDGADGQADELAILGAAATAD